MGKVRCRTLRMSAEVDCTPFLWQLSTNGAEFSTDLANRSLVTRIRKHPDGYVFQKFCEGDLLAHVRVNKDFYLGAVFAVIREWQSHGCAKTDEHRHDFRNWCQSLDWIVQNVFGLAPLLEGHREQQARTANPTLQWLREIALAAKSARMIDRHLLASDLVNIGEEAGINLPGNPNSRDEPTMRVGKLLGPVFREAEGGSVTVDGFSITRSESRVYLANGTAIPQKNYKITAP